MHKAAGRRSLRRGVAIVTVGNLFPPAIALITAPLLAQALGVEGRGILAAVTAPVLFAAAGLTLGLPEAVTFFTARQKSSTKRTLVMASLASTVVGFLGSVLISALAPVIAGGDKYVAELITALGWVLAPTLVMGCVRGVVRGYQMWTLIAINQLITGVARLVAIVAFMAVGALTPAVAGWITVISVLAGGLVFAFVPLVLARRRAKPGDQLADTNQPVVDDRLKTIMKYGLGTWLGAVSGVLLSKLDLILILPLSNAEQLGLYAVAVSIAEAVRVFNMAVRDVTFSSQAQRNDNAQLGRASRLSTLLTIAGAGAIAVLSPLLVPPLFGEEFSPAVPIIYILLVGAVLGNPGSVLAAGLSARGRPVLRSIAILCGVVVNIAAIYLLVPPLGAVGAALASAVASVVTAMVVLYFAKRYFDLPPGDFLRISSEDIRTVLRLLKMRRVA